MSEKSILSGWIGRLIGLVLAVAAVISVFMIDWKKEAPEEPPPIRPLKTIIIDPPSVSLIRNFPGKVKANRRVDLAFDVPGTIIEKAVVKGQNVDEGQILARLDPRDYQNEFDSANAELDRARAHRDRIRIAAEKNAVSLQTLSDAEAAFDVAQAKLRIKEKALDDAFLRARFSGVIANTYVENFETVQAKQPVLSLQNFSSVEIEVNVPESFVARSHEKDITAAKADQVNKLIVTFDYLPGREFEVTLKEFATEADPKTQTYAATLVMPAPMDVNILPGMTGTLHVYRKQTPKDTQMGYTVPIEAVPIDGLGAYHVWKLKEGSNDTYTVHRVNVTVGEMTTDTIHIIEGVESGDRIAAAGVHFLQEGQKVRLLESTSENS